jgi:hypothetical protein
MPESRQLRVFLCHSSQDKPIVRELYQRLLSEGWIDPWLPVGAKRNSSQAGLAKRDRIKLLVDSLKGNI